jgi:flagellar FliL protein
MGLNVSKRELIAGIDQVRKAVPVVADALQNEVDPPVEGSPLDRVVGGDRLLGSVAESGHPPQGEELFAGEKLQDADGATHRQIPVGQPRIVQRPVVGVPLDAQGTRYLKAAITLELNGKAGADEVSERLPQLRDAILLHVGNKTFGELNDLQGKLQLREELIAQLNQLLQKGEISKVYFTDFVVQ